MLNKDDYNHWLAVAARTTRRRDEAEDLLHESLLAAVQARRTDFANPRTRGWFAGMIRNKAAMAARSAGRRKRREAGAIKRPQPALASADDGTFQAIHALPKAARIVAILALHGLTREEIADVLELSDEALRQRLSTLRKRWNSLPEDAREQVVETARRRRSLGDDLETGLIRRALIAFLHEVPGVGTHDPDGHLIVFGRSAPSRISRPRQQKGDSTET